MKKILLYLIAILTPFIFISNVSAGSGFSRENFFMPSQIHFFNCSTSTNCTTDLSVYGSAQDGYFIEAVALGTAGIYIRFVSNVEFKQDYMYSIQSIVCFDGNTSLNPTGKYYPGYSQFNNVIWQRETTSFMDTYDPVTDTQYDVCKLITSIVVPDTNSPYVGLHITNSTKYSNINAYFLGYYVEGLGMYSESMKDYIDEAISTSGYATAASVEEVESSITTMKEEITSAQEETNDKLDTSIKEQQETNDKLQDSIDKQEEIKQEQQETNNKLDDLNDNLTNSDAPDDMDSLSSASGWLPAGPVDSLLTLPLSMLNNLSSSLGNTCKPLDLPLPFVDKNLTLPCLNTIYSQIDGLGTFLNSISIIAGGFILYYYFKNLYKYIDDLLSLKEQSDGWGDV